MRFQSTHPRGVRRSSVTSGCPASLFQSTHPRGVRPSHLLYSSRTWDFNPRTRVGCDLICALNRFSASNFNPRTRVGCDPRRPHRPLCGRGISIHAPAWGATANIHKSTLLFVLSIYLLHKHLSIFWRLSSLLFHSACPSYNFSVRTHRGISVRLDFAPP